MASEDEKVRFPQGMTVASSIKGGDKFLMADADTGITKTADFDTAKQYLSITGESMPAIQGGTTPAAAVALPAGPTGQNRFFDASWGYWKYNNVVLKNPTGTDGIPEGNDGTLYWNGTATTPTWSISKMQALPMPQGVPVINPNGDGIPTEKATAIYVDDKTVKLTHGKNFFNPKDLRVDELITNAGTIGTGAGAIGWAWSGYIDISMIPIGGDLPLSSDKNRTGLAFFPSKGVAGRYLAVNTGILKKQAGDNFMGFNAYSPTENSFTWAQVEYGKVATQYEEFRRIVGVAEVENLSSTIVSATTALTKSTANEIKLLPLTTSKVISKNKLSPASKVFDVLLNVTTGEWVFSLSYFGIDFTQVEAGKIYKSIKSNNTSFTLRQIVFFDINLTVIGAITVNSTSFTTPINTKYIRATFLKTEGADFNLLGIVINTDSFEPYAEYDKVSLSGQLSTGRKSDSDIATIEDVKNLAGAKSIDGFNYSIDSVGNLEVYDNSGNSIKGQVANKRGYNGNDMFNFSPSSFNAITIGSADDVAPQHIMGLTIGANHGKGYQIATISNHGYTNTIIGTEWDKGGVKYYPIRIISTNQIAFLAEYEGTEFSFLFKPALTPGTITYNGISYNITSVIAGTTEQLYPSIGMKYLNVFVDNNKVQLNTLSSSKDLKVIEEYDIYNPASVLNNLRARSGQPQDPDMKGNSACSVKNIYSFKKDFSCIITTGVYYNQPVKFADIMVSQAVQISGNPFYYIPNSAPIGPVDFRKPVQPVFSNDIFINRNNLDPLNPPIRVIQYSGNVGFMIGYLPGFNDLSKTVNLFEIRGSSKKIYPHPVDSGAVGETRSIGDYYEIKLYRTYTDLSNTRTGNRLSYFIVHEENETFIFIDYSGSMVDMLNINLPELSAKKIEVVESRNTVLLSKVFNQGFIVKANYVEGETCFMIVKCGK